MSFTQNVTEDDVHAAYRTILCREIDPGAVTAWRQRLAAHPVELKLLRDEMLSSAEFLGQRAPSWTLVDIGGVNVVVDAREPEFGRVIAEQGSWERHVVDIIKAALPDGAVFVDIGANVGVMSFHAAKAVGPRGKVIGFEPKPENLQALLRGVQANGFTNVSVLPFGASDAATVFALEGHSNAFLADPANGGTLAQCFPADDFLERETRVDFIKIDIEGHEPFALEGLARTISRHHPTVLCEFNPRCLQDHVGRVPADFAEMLFRMTREIVVVHHNGIAEEKIPVHNPEQLLKLWSSHNEDAVLKGRLPDGMLHYDLLFST